LHKVSILILICSVLVIQKEYGPAEDILVALHLILSCLLYYATVGVFVGTKVVGFEGSSNLNSVWMSRVAEAIGLYCLFATGHHYVFFFALPAAIIVTIIDTFATLLQLNYITLDDTED